MEEGGGGGEGRGGGDEMMTDFNPLMSVMVNPPSKSTSILVNPPSILVNLLSFLVISGLLPESVHSNGAQKLENGAYGQVIVVSEDSITLLLPTSSREKVRVFNHDLKGEH